uniref:Ribonuclease Z n=1 Tax=Steinernema glaseri TaxID=37863 RepID=A0A1I7YT75_9BILA
ILDRLAADGGQKKKIDVVPLDRSYPMCVLHTDQMTTLPQGYEANFLKELEVMDSFFPSFPSILLPPEAYKPANA